MRLLLAKTTWSRSAGAPSVGRPRERGRQATNASAALETSYDIMRPAWQGSRKTVAEADRRVHFSHRRGIGRPANKRVSPLASRAVHSWARVGSRGMERTGGFQSRAQQGISAPMGAGSSTGPGDREPFGPSASVLARTSQSKFPPATAAGSIALLHGWSTGCSRRT